MYTKKEVIKKIQQKHITELAIYYLMMLAMPAIFALLIMMVQPKPDDPSFIATVIVGVIASIVTAIIIYKKFINVAPAKKGTNADPVFRAFKNIDGLVAALNEAMQQKAIYENGTIKVTEKYIVNFHDVRTIMRLDEVVNGYVGKNPNGEGDSLFVIDKHDRSCYYTIGGGDDNAARHVGKILVDHCPMLKEKAEKNGVTAL